MTWRYQARRLTRSMMPRTLVRLNSSKRRYGDDADYLAQGVGMLAPLDGLGAEYDEDGDDDESDDSQGFGEGKGMYDEFKMDDAKVRQRLLGLFIQLAKL